MPKIQAETANGLVETEAPAGKKLVLTLEDAGSKNGTWVNGARLEGPVVLADGDLVSFGTFRAVFQGVSALGSTRTGRPR